MQSTGNKLLKPHSKPYKDWKYKFVRARGQDCASMVTTGVNGAPRFAFSWTRDPKTITDFKFDDLT